MPPRGYKETQGTKAIFEGHDSETTPNEEDGNSCERDNHPVDWILIESTRSGILHRTGLTLSAPFKVVRLERCVPIVSIIGITASRQDIDPISDG